MSIEFTIFKSRFHTDTSQRVSLESFEALARCLKGLSQQEGYKPKKDEDITPKCSPLISPAIFADGTTRKNVSVLSWGGWACLDVDDLPSDVSMKDVMGLVLKHSHILYSTASSSEAHPKFRVVLPLTRYIDKEEIRHFWFALNKEFLEIGDPQTKDLARMYYIPAKYPGAFNFFSYQAEGAVIDPTELMGKHPYVEKKIPGVLGQVSPAMAAKILEYRKSQLTKDFKWTSYRNCPFVKPELVAMYRSATNNWYSKMYKIMVSISTIAIRRGYAITPAEIAKLGKEIDADTGSWYKNRPFELEATRALNYALSVC